MGYDVVNPDGSIREYVDRESGRRGKAGLAQTRAQGQGQELGRPTKLDQYRDVLTEMNAKNYSKARMAEETGLAYNTVKKYLRQMETEPA